MPPNPIESQQVCSLCQQAIRHGAGMLNGVPGLIKRILRDGLWQERRLENGKVVQLKTFRELIVLQPLEGWGEDPDKIEAVIRNDPEALALWRKAMRGQEGGDTRSPAATTNNIVISGAAVQGNSRAYTVQRLSEQRPDLFERVVSGELSANAAAIEAGWRKVKTPLERAKASIAKLTDDERQELMNWMTSTP